MSDLENIKDSDLNEEMRSSFLEYAYSVIYARALPDARDGLKPVQRRILYQMSQMNLYPDRPYVKSARVVGDVMGKLHPHGDSAIYDAMVRLAQEWWLRIPLVDGHGNFGSLDDRQAAARYTEARMSPASVLMCQDLDEDVVDFVPNYDNKIQQPDVLPSAIPNLLVNGGTGIAVGMATNMAPHNLREVINGAVYLMNNPDCDLTDLMKYIPGPDLPSGGKIIGLDPIRKGYETGRGIFKMRAKHSVEKIGRKQAIVVTELPYGVGPEKVLKSVSDAVKAGKLEGISAITDLTDRKSGLQIQIDIKNGFNPTAVLAKLYKLTPLEESFGINNVALVNGAPQTLGLKTLLQVWIDHRIEVIRRRSHFRLNSRKDRLHLVEGLLIAILDIDEVIQVIRSSEDTPEASNRLQSVFDLDEIQASYILDLRLRRLTKFSKIELENEKAKLEAEIAELEEMLSSEQRLKDEVSRIMHETAREYGEDRRTVLIDQDTEASIVASGSVSSELFSALPGGSTAAKHRRAEDSLEIADTPCFVVLSATGLIARVVRGAKELNVAPPLEAKRSPHDAISASIKTTTRGHFGVVTSHGRCFLASPLELPEIARGQNVVLDKLDKNTQGIPKIDRLEIAGLSGGMPLRSLVGSLNPTETVVSIIPLYSEADVSNAENPPKPVTLGTTLGVIKRVRPEIPPTDRSGNVHDVWNIINLEEGDSVVGVTLAGDTDEVVFITTDSSLLHFSGGGVRPQGNNAGGMAGVKLAPGQHVIYFGALTRAQLEGEPYVLTVAGDSNALPGTENGHGKLTPFKLYPGKGRATGGVRSQKFLKGQNALIYAAVAPDSARANTSTGTPVELPELDLRRDGSGKLLDYPITCVGSL